MTNNNAGLDWSINGGAGQAGWSGGACLGFLHNLFALIDSHGFDLSALTAFGGMLATGAIALVSVSKEVRAWHERGDVRRLATVASGSVATSQPDPTGVSKP